MVKALSSTQLELSGVTGSKDAAPASESGSATCSSSSSFICNLMGTPDFIAKKIKTTSPLKRLFSLGKGRRKEKEASISSAAASASQGEARPYLDEEFVSQRIVVDASVDRLVMLPQGLSYNEWLATHTISFFDHVNLIYGAVSEFCTTSGCTAMTGPANMQYLWLDERGKKCKCAAPQYVEYVMTYIQKTIHDEAVFPTKYGNPFPDGYESRVKKIHKLLVHVLAHLYQAHYKELLLLHLHPHLNTLFHHFMTFNHQFSLLEDKDCEVMDDLYRKLSEGAPSVVTCSGASTGTTPTATTPLAGTPPTQELHAGMPLPPPPLAGVLSDNPGCCVNNSNNGGGYPAQLPLPPPPPPLEGATDTCVSGAVQNTHELSPTATPASTGGVATSQPASKTVDAVCTQDGSVSPSDISLAPSSEENKENMDVSACDGRSQQMMT